MTFREWKSGEGILLRHDVDFDLFSAHKLALIEKKCKVKSTFFVLTTGHFYNVLSKTNRALLNEINRFGFEIGLHFDPAIYEDASKKELYNKVKEECSVLSSLIGRKIQSISLHNPSVYQKYPLFKNYVNSYDAKFFSEGRYISDSCMVFKKHIYRFIRSIKKEKNPIQILLHPLHFSVRGDSYPEILYSHVLRYINQIEKVFRINHTYRKCIEDNLSAYIKMKIAR